MQTEEDYKDEDIVTVFGKVVIENTIDHILSQDDATGLALSIALGGSQYLSDVQRVSLRRRIISGLSDLGAGASLAYELAGRRYYGLKEIADIDARGLVPPAHRG